MKIRLIFITLALVTHITYGQVERKKKGDYSKFFSRTYNVLKDDKSIKDGPYELTLMGTPIVQGQYDHSERTGVWTYCNSMGEIMYKYDYSSDTLVELHKVKFDMIQWQLNVPKNNVFQFRYAKIVPYVNYFEREFNIINGTEKIVSKLDRPHLMLSSPLQFQFELLDILKSNVSDFGVMSFSIISFVVDSNGTSKDFKVVASSGLNFEYKFLEQLKRKNLKWIPAKLGNNNVNVEMNIPIIIKTNYDDHDFVISSIIFTDIDFMNYYLNLTPKTDYKHLESWDYELYD